MFRLSYECLSFAKKVHPKIKIADQTAGLIKLKMSFLIQIKRKHKIHPLIATHLLSDKPISHFICHFVRKYPIMKKPRKIPTTPN
jgi:hypothetical protein